ncbi:unnamed protein product [Schistosoma curassoni]|nr:unnamed protein product [Schistosoma curassoni]
MLNETSRHNTQHQEQQTRRYIKKEHNYKSNLQIDIKQIKENEKLKIFSKQSHSTNMKRKNDLPASINLCFSRQIIVRNQIEITSTHNRFSTYVG